MPESVSERVLRALSLAFHVALPLLLLALLATLPVLERAARYPWFLGVVAVVVATAAAAASVLAFRRVVRAGSWSDVLLATGFGAVAATYTFGAITTLTGAANSLVPHDVAARLALGLLLVGAVWARRDPASRGIPDARSRLLRAGMAFAGIEAILAMSALLGALDVAIATPSAPSTGGVAVEPGMLADIASVGLFIVASFILVWQPSAPRVRTAAMAGTALLAVGTFVILLADARHVEVAVGQLSVATASLACAGGLVAPRRSLRTLVAGIDVLASRLDDGVFLFDHDQRMRWVNAAGAALTGIAPGATGTPASDVFGTDLAAVELTVQLHEPGRATRYVEIEAAPATGRPLALALSAIPAAEVADAAFTLVVARDTSVQRQDSEDLARLSEELAAMLAERDELSRALDVERAERQRTTTRDVETGLASEHEIMERLRREIAQARRYPHPLAIVLVELREPSEAQGGAPGPVATAPPLREVAMRLQLRLRLGDALGRIGERRFLVVLPHTEEHGAQALADAMRRRVGDEPIQTDAGDLRAEAAVGIAVLKPGVEISHQDLLARAASRLQHDGGSGEDATT